MAQTVHVNQQMSIIVQLLSFHRSEIHSIMHSTSMVEKKELARKVEQSVSYVPLVSMRGFSCSSKPVQQVQAVAQKVFRQPWSDSNYIQRSSDSTVQ